MDLVAVSDIFDMRYGNSLGLNTLDPCHCKHRPCSQHVIPFVSRTAKNNGISAYVAPVAGVALNPSHTLSVAMSGSVLSTFYQGRAYYTGYHVACLAPKISLTTQQMLYYALCLSKNAYRYSYGRQANKTLKSILIPDVESIPTWVVETNIPKISKKPIHRKSFDLDVTQWKEFEVENLFDVKGTKSHTKEHMRLYGKGIYPYVTTSSVDNGIEGFYSHFTEHGNVLTIDSATVGSCFYQDVHFTASDHVEKLVPKFAMNKHIALFLQTIVAYEKFRYGYGRKFAQKRIKNTAIKLPVDNDGNPDWQFMEDYMKSLPYSASL